MVASWSLEPLLTYASTLGPEFRREVETLVRSIDRNCAIFRYHALTARDALMGFVDEGEPQSIKNWKLILGCSQNDEERQTAMVVSEANLIACAHTAINTFEVFAQLINLLLLGRGLTISQCTLKRAEGKLTDSDLKQSIATLRTSHWYKYIGAFVNTVKHRRLVQHQTSMSFVLDRFGIQIGAFEYEGEKYPECWCSEFLERAASVQGSLGVLGVTLNNEISTILANARVPEARAPIVPVIESDTKNSGGSSGETLGL